MHAYILAWSLECSHPFLTLTYIHGPLSMLHCLKCLLSSWILVRLFVLMISGSGSLSVMILRWALQDHHGPFVIKMSCGLKFPKVWSFWHVSQFKLCVCYPYPTKKICCNCCLTKNKEIAQWQLCFQYIRFTIAFCWWSTEVSFWSSLTIIRKTLCFFGTGESETIWKHIIIQTRIQCFVFVCAFVWPCFHGSLTLSITKCFLAHFTPNPDLQMYCRSLTFWQLELDLDSKY